MSKKIYGVAVTITDTQTTYVYAESKEDAEIKVAAMYSEDVDGIEYMGGNELDSSIVADQQAVPSPSKYSEACAIENEEFYKSIDTQ